MHIINIGPPISGSNEYLVTDYEFFNSNTFLDGEIIFWDMEYTYNKMPGTPDKPSTISFKDLKSYKSIIKLRRDEFKEFFSLGRVLFITSPSNYSYQYNCKEDPTNIDINIWSCLEINPPKISFNSGKNIGSVDNKLIKQFIESNKMFLRYNRKIEESSGIPLFYIKGTKHVIGEFYTVKKGLIVIIPQIKFINNYSNKSIFFNSIEDLIIGIWNFTKSSQVPFPKLIDNYILEGEETQQKLYDDLLKKKNAIEKKISIQESTLYSYNRLKLLFSGDGELLESECRSVFKYFGFTLIKPDEKRDDLIIQLNDLVAVIEIKGVSKSSAEKHSAQLQKWVSDYYANNGKNPKGILIVNTYKNTPLEKRTEIDFPDQMMNHVKQMGHCLITGVQLLAIFLDFQAKKIDQNKVIEILFETIGEVKYIKEIQNYIKLKHK